MNISNLQTDLVLNLLNQKEFVCFQLFNCLYLFNPLMISLLSIMETSFITKR